MVEIYQSRQGLTVWEAAAVQLIRTLKIESILKTRTYNIERSARCVHRPPQCHTAVGQQRAGLQSRHAQEFSYAKKIL